MIFYLDWSFLKYVDLIRKPFPSAVVYVPLKKSFEGFICFYVIMQQSVVQCNSMCSLVHRVVLCLKLFISHVNLWNADCVSVSCRNSPFTCRLLVSVLSLEPRQLLLLLPSGGLWILNLPLLYIVIPYMLRI